MRSTLVYLQNGTSSQYHMAKVHVMELEGGLNGLLHKLVCNDLLTTPYQLFEFKSNVKNIHCQFATTEMYHFEAEYLTKRFQAARTIPGTQKLDSFRPLSTDKVEGRPFSAFTEGRVEKVQSGKVHCG